MKKFQLFLFLLTAAFSLIGQNIESELTTENFISVEAGFGKYWNSDFAPSSRMSNIFQKNPNQRFFPANDEGVRSSIRISYGRKVSQKLYWIAGLSYSKVTKLVGCPCRFCLKAFPSTPSVEKVYQVSFENGVRWNFIEKQRFELGLEATTGLKLDINQDAPIPLFYSIAPIINFKLSNKHSFLAKTGFVGQTTGYREYTLNANLGYQYAF